MTGERPRRIQRQRKKGWRMPEGAIYVGRPSRWGNPFTPILMAESGVHRIAHWLPRGRQIVLSGHEHLSLNAAMADAVRMYRARIENWIDDEYDGDAYDAMSELRGHDLACWCRLDEECHADVLLELANDDW